MATPIDSLRYASFLASNFRKQDMQPLIISMLLELGIRDVGNELQLFKYAIPMYFKNPSILVTKELYPAVGKLCATNVAWDAAERTMRYAIKTAWKTRDKEVWSRYLPGNPCDGSKPPSISEFISRISGFLEIWQSCYGEDLQM